MRRREFLARGAALQRRSRSALPISSGSWATTWDTATSAATASTTSGRPTWTAWRERACASPTPTRVHGLRALPQRAHDGTAHGPHLRAVEPRRRAAARLRRDRGRGAPAGRLRDRRFRQMGARRYRHRAFRGATGSTSSSATCTRSTRTGITRRTSTRNAQRFPLEGNTGGARGTYSHDAIAARALDFIRRSAARPFFCYVPFTVPHWELLVPDDSLAPYRKLPEAAPYVDPRRHYADQPYPRAAYAGMVSRLDRDVGRILNLLDELKLAGNTIVFFTSDNGSAERLRKDEFFNGTAGFRGHKQNLYEGGIRVPMIARWPGRIAAGAESDFAWAFQDFLPTAAELAGAPAPRESTASPFCPPCSDGEIRPRAASARLPLLGIARVQRRPANSQTRFPCRPCAWATGRRCRPRPTARSSCTIWSRIRAEPQRSGRVPARDGAHRSLLRPRAPNRGPSASPNRSSGWGRRGDAVHRPRNAKPGRHIVSPLRAAQRPHGIE